MTNNFQKMSEGIVSDFIQSIVFIDDKAYEAPGGEDVRHDFDVKAIVKNFARNEKICSIFQPEQESDIELFSAIAKKADVTVLDWQIIIGQCSSSSPDGGNDGEDDEEEDVRGLYTKQIIGHLIRSPSSQNSLKMILIYTGETDLEGIAREILEYLNDKQGMVFEHPCGDPCCVESGNFRILVRAKANGGPGRYKHIPERQHHEVSYEDLPEFIDNEFSKLTNGLLSIFALKALTEIRRNHFQILNIFSKKLDAGYLTHQSLLPNGDDANELLVDLLGDTFTSILRAQNLNTMLNKNITDKWIEQYVEDEPRSQLGSKMRFTRNKDLLKLLLESSEDVPNKFSTALSKQHISKNDAKKNFNGYAFSLFHTIEDGEIVNRKFALLCQHKNLIRYDNFIPILTLGTVVKSTTHNKYYICVQQRCDSNQLKHESTRRFLFLSLSLVSSENEETNFDIVTEGGDKLRLDSKTYDVRTIKFCGSGNQRVEGLRDGSNNKIYFQPSYYSADHDEKLEFFFELKDLYSQRIIDNYCSSLSRVGVDEPEWIRRSDKNKPSKLPKP